MLPDPREHPLLSVAELAKNLPHGVGEKGVRAAIAAGQIPHIRLGRRVLVPTARYMREVLGFDPNDNGPGPPSPGTVDDLAAAAKPHWESS
jgi:excisionase family DNA binding protein